MFDAPAAITLKPWQVLLGGICSLVLTVGLARFAYTPLLPQMHAQAGLGWPTAACSRPSITPAT